MICEVHNLTSNPTYHTDPALLMHCTVSAYSQDRPYLPCPVYSNYIAATHTT